MKVISTQEAVGKLSSHMRLGIGGFGGWSGPDELLKEIGASFAQTQTPKDLTIVAGVCPGDLREDGFGMSAIRAPGIISTLIGAHVGMPPAIGRAVGSNQIAGFTIPLGVFGNLMRAAAAKRPGLITTIGLHTFADPRLDGCCANQKAKEQGRDLVSLLPLDGKDYLLYKTKHLAMDACIMRGTYSDEDGNISMEEEPLLGEQLEMATAVHNSGGMVIVQVKEIVQRGSIKPRDVYIHSSLVDYVVKAKPENHPQGYDFPALCRPELTGAAKITLSSIPPMPLSYRKIIGRRGAMELKAGALVNLGIGMPDGVAAVANEEGIASSITLSIESGTFGGVPVGGVGLGASINPEAVYRIADNFNLYDGGGLDSTFLGMAEIDAQGNVNVSKFGVRCTGPGGFINISQSAPVVSFMGSFTAGKMKCEIRDGKLNILEDGSGIKFKKSVEQITFSSKYAQLSGQHILYITERAVFRLTEEGLTLIEIAPGVDLNHHILSKMEFVPKISPDLKEMDNRIFREEKMGLLF